MATREMRNYTTWQRACDARDAAYDGIFFVAITSTKIYCRPICPSRRARPERRRFFESSAEAERAGYRPCRRCCPGRAPGEAPVDAVQRLARIALARITGGALDRGTVATLARELGVSDRQLRRAVERELGATPIQLAQRLRLRRARALLARPGGTVSAVAYESGFRSLRRFNAAFRQRYGTAPREMRRAE